MNNEEKPEEPEEKPELVEVNVRDPITRRLKKVKTRRIRRTNFYGSDGNLVDETSED